MNIINVVLRNIHFLYLFFLDGHLGWFQFLALMKRVVMNLGEQVCLL